LMWPRYINIADRRADRRTDGRHYNSISALYTRASRIANVNAVWIVNVNL